MNHPFMKTLYAAVPFLLAATIAAAGLAVALSGCRGSCCAQVGAGGNATTSSRVHSS